jgi:hypothetical protein
MRSHSRSFPFVRLSALTLAILLIPMLGRELSDTAQAEAATDQVFIAGSTNGCFGAGCTPSTTASIPGLSYSNGTFSGTTDDGILRVNDNYPNPGSVNNLGSFTLSTAPNTFNTTFTLEVTFTDPQGFAPSSTITRVATVRGIIGGPESGHVTIDFDNTAVPLKFNDTDCGTTTIVGQQTTCGRGSFSFAVLDQSVYPGGDDATLSGVITAAGQVGGVPATNRPPPTNTAPADLPLYRPD